MSSSRKILSDSGAVFILILMAIPLLGELSQICAYARSNVPLEYGQLASILFWLCVITVGLLYYGTNFFRRNQHRGPLADRSDWPDPIRRLDSFLKEAGVETESFSVWLLDGKPNRVLSTVVCRLNVDDNGWRVLQEKLELQLVSESVGGSIRDSVISRSDESWWPASSESVEFFAGEESDPYTVACDKVASRVFIFYEYD